MRKVLHACGKLARAAHVCQVVSQARRETWQSAWANVGSRASGMVIRQHVVVPKCEDPDVRVVKMMVYRYEQVCRQVGQHVDMP